MQAFKCLNDKSSVNLHITENTCVAFETAPFGPHDAFVFSYGHYYPPLQHQRTGFYNGNVTRLLCSTNWIRIHYLDSFQLQPYKFQNSAQMLNLFLCCKLTRSPLHNNSALAPTQLLPHSLEGTACKPVHLLSPKMLLTAPSLLIPILFFLLLPTLCQAVLYLWYRHTGYMPHAQHN